MLIHWDVDGVWSSMSISDSVPAGGPLLGFPWAGNLIVSFSLAWLCISLAVCSHCSDCVGLFANSVVMSAFERLMLSETGSLAWAVSLSLPLPFSFLLWFGLGCWSLLELGWFFFWVPLFLWGMGFSPNLMWQVLHSLWVLAWLSLQLTQHRGVSSVCSSVEWSFALHWRHLGVVQLLDACENIPHLLHTCILFSYGVTVQLKLNSLTDLRLRRVSLSFLEVRLMTMEANCLDWTSLSEPSHFSGVNRKTPSLRVSIVQCKRAWSNDSGSLARTQCAMINNKRPSPLTLVAWWWWAWYKVGSAMRLHPVAQS